MNVLGNPGLPLEDTESLRTVVSVPFKTYGHNLPRFPSSWKSRVQVGG